MKDILYSRDTPQGRFIRSINNRILSSMDANLPGYDQEAGFILCDEWVMALFLNPEICTKSRVWSTEVELAGRLTRGQCVVDKRFYGRSSDGKNQVRHVLALDKERMKEMLVKMATVQNFPKQNS